MSVSTRNRAASVLIIEKKILATSNGNKSFAVFYVLGFALLVVVAGAVWFFWKGKEAHQSEEVKTREAALAQGPKVAVVSAWKGPSTRKLVLVGEALPDKQATLYSKVSGYLAKISVDVGDRVKAGQFIAEIQSPEIDQQMNTLKAGIENKQRVLDRTKDLAAQGFFSKQSQDNAQTELNVAQSQLNELRTVSRFRVLNAPFDGVVTRRYADPGALVQNAATNQTSALPIVTIADISKLKVSVYVEQAEAPNIKPGLEVEIADAANAARKVKGKVSRVAAELDSRTRTLLTEVDFDNSKGEFVAGSFVNVILSIPATAFIEVPASALVSRDKKNFAAIVGADANVQLRPIEVAGTDGKVLRIASGVAEGDKVALSLPASVGDGAKVSPTPPPPGTPGPLAPAAAPPRPAKP
ncbi:MAG: efflux RND transporter periplasmic adaptor subunit [Betaproteobacteria bacterium]|nr:efflux RND transporter periplasmic adaptor subunit [Betaproteobacteria bacterium]